MSCFPFFQNQFFIFAFFQNQFFISSLEGEIKNKIGEALYKRIVRAHRWGSQTPRKYVFYVTSVGQRSSPWPCNSVKVELNHLECKLNFPSAQLMLRQMHLMKVFERIEAKYRVFWLRFWRLTSVNTSYQNCLEFVILCSNRWFKIEVTARQKKCISGAVSVSRNFALLTTPLPLLPNNVAWFAPAQATLYGGDGVSRF